MAHKDNQQLLELLSRCASTCDHCAMACLDDTVVKDLVHCIKLDLDCAAICRQAAMFVARGSQYAESMLAECAGICLACATECEKHADMQHCKECAEICRECAAACSQPVVS
jgi:hypothetical protein